MLKAIVIILVHVAEGEREEATSAAAHNAPGFRAHVCGMLRGLGKGGVPENRSNDVSSERSVQLKLKAGSGDERRGVQ